MEESADTRHNKATTHRRLINTKLNIIIQMIMNIVKI